MFLHYDGTICDAWSALTAFLAVSVLSDIEI